MPGLAQGGRWSHVGQLAASAAGNACHAVDDSSATLLKSRGLAPKSTSWPSRSSTVKLDYRDGYLCLFSEGATGIRLTPLGAAAPAWNIGQHFARGISFASSDGYEETPARIMRPYRHPKDVMPSRRHFPRRLPSMPLSEEAR